MYTAVRDVMHGIVALNKFPITSRIIGSSLGASLSFWRLPAPSAFCGASSARFNDAVVATEERMELVVRKKPRALLKPAIILKKPGARTGFSRTCLYRANMAPTYPGIHSEYTETVRSRYTTR